MPQFLDFLRKPLPFLRSELRGDRKEVGREDERESWLICKINLKNLKGKKILKESRGMNMKESLVKRYMAGVRETKGKNIVIIFKN